MMIQVEFVSHVGEGFILIGIIHPMINTNLDNLTGHLVKGGKNEQKQGLSLQGIW